MEITTMDTKKKGCSECREWAMLKAQMKLPVGGDTYCARCGAREADVSGAIKRLIRERDKRRLALRSKYPDAYLALGQWCGPNWQDTEREDKEIDAWFNAALAGAEKE